MDRKCLLDRTFRTQVTIARLEVMGSSEALPYGIRGGELRNC
jgi:hypothetical protein